MDKAKENITKLLSTLALGLVVLSIYSCEVPAPAPEPPTYNPPLHVFYKPYDSVRTIDKGFDEVWVALIEASSSRFFARQRFEKASGLLTLWFGSGKTSEFVDCGSFKTPYYAYEGPIILWRLLSFNLDGSMNIFVKHISDNLTQVRINARYILQAGERNEPHLQTWVFDTGGSDTKQIEGINVTCQPTYKAEKTILDRVDLIVHKVKPLPDTRP